MKRKTVIAIGIGTAVVLALGGGYAYSAANNRPLVGSATAAVGQMSVTVSASGSLVAAHSRGVYPPAPGTIAKLRVADGDTVEAGQALAVMATGPLKLAVAQARANLSAAVAQVEAVRNGVPSAIDRSAAGAALSAARSQVSTAAKNYSAFVADYRDATSEERRAMRPTLRTLRTAKSQAAAALKAAQAGLGKLSVASRVALAQTAAAQAVTAADQALTQATRNLARAELTAPFAGTVSFHGTVERGSGLTPGVAVFTVTDPARMDFGASVNETDIAAVAKDQPATITLDAFTEPFKGKVTRVLATPETTGTGTVAFGVRVAFDGGRARLFSGMSGSAEIEVQSIPEALTVPIEAVLTDGSARSVFVLAADDTVHRRQVTVGAATDSAAQVTSGLAAGDRVVTTGASGLVDGQQVRTR